MSYQATIFDAATGRIVQSMTTDSEDSVLAVLAEGQDYIAGRYLPACQYIRDGLALDIPERPEDGWDWDYTVAQWVDGRGPDWIAAQTEVAMTALRAERDARIAAVQWRLQRWRDERELGLTTTDDGAALLAYVQALRDLPETTIDPAAPIWPALPES